MRKSRPDPEPVSPIPFRHGSNGEVAPPEETALDRRAEEAWRRIVDDRSRRLGMSRRQFVESAAGGAAALLVVNQTYGCGGGGGTTYAVDASMTTDVAAACERLGGDEFIMDVQLHHVNPDGAWRQDPGWWELYLASLPQASCGEADAVDCFDLPHFAREVFVNSDTSVGILTAVPADPGRNPLEMDELASSREAINELARSRRLLIHGQVLPDQGQAQLDGMQRLDEELDVVAWKAYTQYGNWRLDDETGAAFIEKARELDIKRICVHKGLALPGSTVGEAPDDVGPAAAAFPDVQFVVYHSAYDQGSVEGPYDPDAPSGIDRLIRTCLDHGIGTTGNVYAELGSTFRMLMTRPTELQHALGKLLLHLGPDRIVWGTDSIWYGSPQDQIVAFRAVQISPELQEQHGYPAITDEIRRKIFGLNSAALYGIDPDEIRCAIREDDLADLKRQATAEPLPRFRAYGPRTRRELFAFLRGRGGEPG